MRSFAPRAALAALCVAVAAPHAQDPRPPSTGAWRVQTAPQVDLWLHGLAVLGYGARLDFLLGGI